MPSCGIRCKSARYREQMTRDLKKEAIIKFASGVILIGLLLFLPAGTIRWKNGWLLMGVLFIPMFLAGMVMLYKAPDLLQSRLKAKESQKEQKDVIRYSGLLFLATFILAGLNYRFSWIPLPNWIVRSAVVVFLAAYCLFGEVLRENRYLSRTIQVQEGQTIVDTGVYGIVRHPMYFATVFLFLSMPLILGSVLSFILMLLYIPIIMKRIRNEEEILARELTGYDDYRKKVKYRLLPLIW